MPVQQTVVDQLIEMARYAQVWVGITKPDNFTYLDIPSGEPASGTSIGLTTNGVKFSYKPKVEGMDIDQTLGKVAQRVVDEEASVTFTIAEEGYDRLLTAIPNGSTLEVPGTGATPTKKGYFIGGGVGFPSTCLALISKIGSYTYMSSVIDCYEVLVIYVAANVDGLAIEYMKTKTRVWQVNMMAFHDPTRSELDQLYQHFWTSDPN